ncbi:MAG: DUF4097 family beta strand repeat protein [Ruminococcus sp.]|nr:DUF4097 family beta strand repeat protein [Ruminococcus sp.]
MDYQFRDIITTVVAELHDGALSVVRNTNHMVRVTVEDAPENGMRLFVHNSTLFVKSLTNHPTDIQMYVPETVKIVHIESKNSDVMLTELDLDQLHIGTAGDCSIHAVKAAKQTDICCEGGDIALQECDLRSMSIQLTNGSLEIWGTKLSGNNMIFATNSILGGRLRGALVDYVISAGSGINPDDVMVNGHLLSEFPERRNTQEAAWLLLAGQLNGETVLNVAK